MNQLYVCPRYCRTCGLELLQTKGIFDTRTFDEHTGEPVYETHVFMTCPRAAQTGWRWLFETKRHDHREFSEDCSIEYFTTTL